MGVGGAVLREKTNELLIIKERVRNREFWKVKAPRQNVANREHFLLHSYLEVSSSVVEYDNGEHVHSLLGTTELSEDLGEWNTIHAEWIETIVSFSRWCRTRSVRRNGCSVQSVLAITAPSPFLVSLSLSLEFESIISFRQVHNCPGECDTLKEHH